MANSIREQILLKIINETLVPVAQKYNAELMRQPAAAVDENTPIVLAVFPDTNTPNERKNNVVPNQLRIRVVPQVYETAAKPKHVETLSDEILVDVHKALFADRTFGGLATGIVEEECNWINEYGELYVGQIPAVYAIEYRTKEADISAKG
jgi:hypothetical protein